MANNAGKKKENDRRELIFGVGFFALLSPVLLLAIGGSIVMAQFALNGLMTYPGSKTAILGILLFFVIAPIALVVLVIRRWKRWNFVLDRRRSIQLEQQRTANLLERDTSHLEISASEVNITTLPDDEQREMQRKA